MLGGLHTGNTGNNYRGGLVPTLPSTVSCLIACGLTTFPLHVNSPTVSFLVLVTLYIYFYHTDGPHSAWLSVSLRRPFSQKNLLVHSLTLLVALDRTTIKYATFLY